LTVWGTGAAHDPSDASLLQGFGPSAGAVPRSRCDCLFHIETTEEDRFVIEKALQTLLINPVSGQISEVYVPRITKTRKEKTKRVWMPLKESPPDEDRIIID